MVWDEIRPRFLSRDASQAAWCPIRSSPYKTQFRALFVDQASLLAILALCRQNKTTVIGLIHGLELLAFASHLSTARPRQDFKVLPSWTTAGTCPPPR